MHKLRQFFKHIDGFSQNELKLQIMLKKRPHISFSSTGFHVFSVYICRICIQICEFSCFQLLSSAENDSKIIYLLINIILFEGRIENIHQWWINPIFHIFINSVFWQYLANHPTFFNSFFSKISAESLSNKFAEEIISKKCHLVYLFGQNVEKKSIFRTFRPIFYIPVNSFR